MTETDFSPAFLTAGQLLVHFASGDLSPVELLRRQFERIDAADLHLRLFIRQQREQALADARRAEAAWRAGRPDGPLCGITFSVKDTLAVAGQPHSLGSRLYADHIAVADHPAVARLRAAGAVLVGITNTPEFAQKPTGENRDHGTARNPWNPAFTTGGSSSGAAGSVAAGMCTLALGTDAGGSIRTPASCCGVLGLKATHGLVPGDGSGDEFNALSQAGPLTRSVADLALAMGTVTGRHAAGPWPQTLQPDPARTRFDGLHANGDLRGLRIGWMPDIGPAGQPGPIDRQVRTYCEAALQKLARLGAEVGRVHADLSASSAILGVIGGVAHHHRHAALLQQHADRLPPGFRRRLEAAARISAEQLQQAWMDRTAFFHTVQALFGDTDVIATPTLSAPPVAAEADPAEALLIDGLPTGPLRTAWIHYCHPFNLSGHPALSVPAGWTDAGLPVGIQFIGRWHAEATLLKVAAELEAQAPWLTRRPPDHAF